MTAAESLGAGWMDAVHPDDLAPYLRELAGAVREGGVFELEYRLRRQDGSFRWFLSRAEPVVDDAGEVARWIGTCTDIDDRKRASDQRLRENAERLRLAAAAARLGYWEWDIVADRVTWSQSLEQIWGTTPEQFGATLEGFLGHVHPDERGPTEAAVRQAVDEGTPYEAELRIAKPDGTYRWGLSRGQAYYDRKGRPVRMSGIDVDITARKEAEEQARRNEERFRASVDTLLDCFGVYTAVRDDGGRIIDFRIDFVNEPACRNNRMSRERQIGRGLLEILPAHRDSG